MLLVGVCGGGCGVWWLGVLVLVCVVWMGVCSCSLALPVVEAWRWGVLALPCACGWQMVVYWGVGVLIVTNSYK
jgi:hypothetical protein